MFVFCFLLHGSLLLGVIADAKLEQPPSELGKPGASVKLPCQASGYTFTSYSMHWIQQTAEKQFKYIGWINTANGNTGYYDPFKGRVTITKEDSTSTSYLQIDSLGSEDTATYYCARHGGSASYAYFDHWGSGTTVTVTSASPSAPSLFPLISCDTSTGADMVVGCLAKNFLPDTIEFSWTDKSNNSYSNGLKKYNPILQSQGTYLASSLITVTSKSWDGKEPFYCVAKHTQNTNSVKLVKQGDKSRPIVTMHPPIKEDLEAYGNSTIVCRMRAFRPSNIQVTWRKDNAPTTLNVVTEDVIPDNNGGFMRSSYITVSKAEWDANTLYSCIVTHAESEFFEIRNLSKSSACEYSSPPSGINVYAIPPSFEIIYLEKKAPLSCLISNMNTKEGLEVSWFVNDKEITENTELYDVVFNDNGTYSIKAVATVCPEDWNNEKVFECRVKHPDLANPQKVKFVKPNGKRSTPTVLVFPPHQDELARKERATVTCMVKYFYPSDILVKWLDSDNRELTNVVTTGPIKESNLNEKETYFIISILTLPSTEEWNSGKSFTCMVGHESLPLQAIQRSVDKTFARVFYIEEDDDIDNLWTTASTFIVLFLLSLFYSATVTLFKVK